ncbi:MAG: hypothetical protein AB9917_10265 [Negativicutes bacterium]
MDSCNAEKAMEYYHKLGFMADMMPSDIACFSVEYMQYIFVNLNFTKIYNLLREQIMGARVADILTPEAYQTALPYIELARQGRVVAYEVFFLLTMENGGNMLPVCQKSIGKKTIE